MVPAALPLDGMKAEKEDAQDVCQPALPPPAPVASLSGVCSLQGKTNLSCEAELVNWLMQRCCFPCCSYPGCMDVALPPSKVGTEPSWV